MAKNILDDLSCDDPDYITNAEYISCKYCGERSIQNNVCYSRHRLEKETVLNHM